MLKTNIFCDVQSLGRHHIGIIRPKNIILAHNCVKSPPYPNKDNGGLLPYSVLKIMFLRCFAVLGQRFSIETRQKNPVILLYFGIFLCRINLKYQAKTDLSLCDDAPVVGFFDLCEIPLFCSRDEMKIKFSSRIGCRHRLLFCNIDMCKMEMQQ